MYTIDELKNFLPKDKSDGGRLEKFDTLTDGEILPVLCDIFAWTADMNCPVAEKCRDIVIAHQNAAMPFIGGVLRGEISLERGEDLEWQYFILTDIVPLLTPENRQLIKADIARISKFPQEEYRENAKEVLKKFF